MTSYVCRGDSDVLHELLFHLLYLLTVLELITHGVTHLSDGLVLVLLETFTGTVNHLQPVVELLFYVCRHVSIGYLDTVDVSLVDEEFLYCYLFGYGTVGVAAPFHTFHSRLHAHALDIRLQDGLIANDPYHLVDDAVGRDDRISRSNGVSWGGP